MDNLEEIQKLANICLNCKTRPCVKGCPLNNSIPDFIQAVKQGDIELAYKILSETTVFPAICGRICPHNKQCQGSCVRGIKGEPTPIGKIEAFVGDWSIKNNSKLKKYYESSNKKIAIIGGGPAGITCAARLAQKGFLVTIYEKSDQLGGLLVHGIPNFRLDKKVVRATIRKITDLGINVILNAELGKNIFLDCLCNQYDAIFLSFGANCCQEMGINGENLTGVFSGNELLETRNHPQYKNKKVAVIGGGNVAMDTARTINRMGAKEVFVLYRRAEKQMPAEPKEIADAKQEGIKFCFQTNVVQILGDENKIVKKVECIKTELVKVEGQEREVPIDIENSNFFLDMDYVVMAVGSKPEKSVVESLGLKLDKRGYIQIDENYKTSIEKVFAGGDIAKCTSTVAWASRSGKNAANKIEEYLNSK